jgi:uncharacterized protein
MLNDLKNKLSPIFAQDNRIVAVYLFGSNTDGTAHPQSDIDIGIMIEPTSEKPFTMDDEIELEIQIEAVLKTDNFDLVVINKVPLILQFRIISPAQHIYIANDDRRCNLEERIILEYYDFSPRLREFNREYLEALEEELNK